MYDRILVPLDGSAHAREVLPYAAGMAAVHGTTLTLLRIVDRETERHEAARQVESLAASYSAQSLCVVEEDDVAIAILQEAGHAPNTLVALTSHGSSGLREKIIGSVGLRVARGRGAPVLVYRPVGKGEVDHKPTAIKRVVLSLDGSELSESMAEDAAQLAAWLGVRLVVVGVITPDAGPAGNVPASDVSQSAYVRSRAQELAAKYHVEPSWEILHGRPAEAISTFAAEDPATILAMTTRGRAPLGSAFLGSVTEGCLRRAGVPVFVRIGHLRRD
ncbi:MAG TPA: universal stress protein [Nevskiaceae bacterium]